MEPGQAVAQILTVKQKEGHSGHFNRHHDKHRDDHVPVHDEGAEGGGVRAQSHHQCLGIGVLSTRMQASIFLRRPWEGDLGDRRALDRRQEEIQHRPEDGQDLCRLGALELGMASLLHPSFSSGPQPCPHLWLLNSVY